MKPKENDVSNLNLSSSYRLTYWLGGLSSLLLILYSLATILIMVFIGPPPESVTECFEILEENKFFGLLRLDILTIFIMPLYYLLFYSIYKALRNTDSELVPISTLLVFAGVTLFLATPSAFSYLHLSDAYSTAVSDIHKNQLIAGGEAMLASDMWHGSGAKVGGILLQTGALLVSFTMLKPNVFSKFTAYTGIVTHGLDLAHILIGFFIPTIGMILLAIAGPLYFVWFALIGKRLFGFSALCRELKQTEISDLPD